MIPVLGETITLDFITSSSTGAAVDADSTPACEVFEDANDTPLAAPPLVPTPVKRTSKTGNYRVQLACTSGNGFEVGKSYNVVASATVGLVAAKAIVARFQIRAHSTDDVRLDTTQPVPLTNTPQTTGDALNAALAQGFGRWVIDGTAKTLTLYGGDGTTIVKVFSLDSLTNTLTRT